jgi:hypothetical protein
MMILAQLEKRIATHLVLGKVADLNKVGLST